LFRQVLQQQIYVIVMSVLNLVSDFVKCNHPIGLTNKDFVISAVHSINTYLVAKSFCTAYIGRFPSGATKSDLDAIKRLLNGARPRTKEIMIMILNEGKLEEMDTELQMSTLRQMPNGKV
jgi:hypothetical protein